MSLTALAAVSRRITEVHDECSNKEIIGCFLGDPLCLDYFLVD